MHNNNKKGRKSEQRARIRNAKDEGIDRVMDQA